VKRKEKSKKARKAIHASTTMAVERETPMTRKIGIGEVKCRKGDAEVKNASGKKMKASR
jgi:hypothetical protein